MTPAEYHDSDIHNSRIAEIRGLYNWHASDDAERTRRFTDTGHRAATWIALAIGIGLVVMLVGAKFGWWVA